MPLEVEPTNKKLPKIVLVAGSRSHGPGDHEFFAGTVILMKMLAQNGVAPVMARDSWPKNEKVFDGATAVMFYADGGGANSSGVGIANIDSQGNVHPDQFWQTATLGNVRERTFSEIWSDSSLPLLAQLRNRLPLLKGRCGACRFQKICGGSFRVRAQQVYNDPWAEDPACYLSDAEIGLR